MTTTRAISLASAAVGWMAGTLLAIPANAQTVPANATPTDSAPKTDPATTAGNTASDADIVVTAQKRSERLNEVPISIAAISGDQLTQQGIKSPADLGKVVLGFSYQDSAYQAPVFSIRGIGFYDLGIGSSPTVSVYVDQVPVPYLVMAEGVGLDAERVEVLKGPQGTLFGQNSTGGAINYIAAKPTIDLHAGFDLSYARFNDVDAQAYVSGPLADGLRFRVAARHEYRDGWQISQSRPNDRLGNRDFSEGRVLLDWDATSRLRFELNVNGWVNRSDTTANQFFRFQPQSPGNFQPIPQLATLAPAPSNPRIADWDPGVSFRRNAKFYQFSGRADWDVDDAVTVTSITAYAHFKTFFPRDLDGTPYLQNTTTESGTIKSFSQELRAAVDLRGIKLTVGGNYQSDNTSDDNLIQGFGTNDVLGPFRFNDLAESTAQRVKTYAGFASVNVPLTSTLSTDLGVRYTTQDRSFQGCLRDAGDGQLAAALALVPTLAGLPYNPAPPGACVTLNADFTRPTIIKDNLNENNVSWRASLNWKPSRDLLVYGNITKGYKAGTFSPVPAIFRAQLAPATQESVLAYELGTKFTFFDRRVDLTAAGFYYDYRNKQIDGTITIAPFGQLPSLVNVPRASVRGAEVGVTVRPVRGLSVLAGATYIDSKIDGSYITSDPNGAIVDANGESFPNAPKLQLIGNAQYQFAVSSTLKLFVGTDVSYRTKTNTNLGANPLFLIHPYALVGISGGIESADQRWRIQIWGRNVLNKFYIINAVHPGDTIFRTAGEPATYGVTLTTKF